MVLIFTFELLRVCLHVEFLGIGELDKKILVYIALLVSKFPSHTVIQVIQLLGLYLYPNGLTTDYIVIQFNISEVY